MSNLADFAAACLQIACPACRTINRTPVGGAEAQPQCSECGAALATNPVADLDEATFSSFVASKDRPALVNFWAPWCSPSRAGRPLFRNAAAALHPGVRFAEVNIETSPEFADRMEIYTIPTLILLKDGREVERVSGPVDFEDLAGWMSARS
jgi:thioredoxin 2